MAQLTPATCRAARGLLGWKREDLAKRAGVSLGTVNSFETERRRPVPQNLAAIQQALEAAGVELIVPGNGGPGARLRDNP